MKILVKRLPHAEGLPLPKYQTLGSAGMDLVAAVECEQIIEPGSTASVPTGLTIALPQGYEAQVRPRSGLAIRHAVTLINSPGTIDSDYRGEICVLMINHGKEPFVIHRGDRIAQMIIAQYEQALLEEVDGLPKSDRGSGGFGHTGRSDIKK
jgi:dUTP pyrophosphatase